MLTSKIDQITAVKTFDNGTSALEELNQEKNHPDVIFVDINMPIMSGWEFLSELEQKSPNFRSSVFIISSSNETMKTSHTTAGKKVYSIYKPISVDELKNLLAPISIDQLF